MESALKSMSSGAASPYVFIGKKYIGDSKEILVLSQQDKLKELLGAAGAAEHPKPPHVLKK
jgi:glutaredoxin-related protein